MSETRFTPGPWHRNIPPASKYNMVFAGRNTHVAAIQARSGMSDEEVEANCDLVTASPELYAALDDLYRDTVEYMIINSLGKPEDKHSLRWAASVLAKARGEQPS